MPKEKSIIQKIKEELPHMKKKRMQALIANSIKFAAENRNCLIIVGDTKTDDLIAVYNKHYCAAKINKKILFFTTGREIIKSILYREGNYKVAIDKFCQFIDAFLWNLSEKLQSQGRGEAKKK